MTPSDASAITDALAELVGEIAPDVRLVPKYGGHVMCTDPNSDKTFVGGIFTYKDHVSLEFSNGASLNDPNAILEGKGKNRRHLKLQSASDIAAKDAQSFLTQVL